MKLKLFLILRSKQINQPNKSLRYAKSGKLINYSPKTNSIILLPLLVINNILNDVTVFYVLSCHFHMPHRYICFLVEQSTCPEGTFPNLVFRLLFFWFLLFPPIKRFVSWSSRFSVPGFIVPDLVFQHSMFRCSVFRRSWFYYMSSGTYVETRCRIFLVLEFRCRGFSVL